MEEEGEGEEEGKLVVQAEEPIKKLYTRRVNIILLISVFLVVIAITLLLVLVFRNPAKNITESQILEGASVELEENQKVKFVIDEEKHSLIIDSIKNDSVIISIESNRISAEIKIREEKKFDLDNNSIYDLQVKLENLTAEKATIGIKKIEEEIRGPCVENWACVNWTSCINGNRTRNCTDRNVCNTSENKPATRESCNMPCVENWDCGGWSACVNRTQTRNCTDSNNCGSEIDMPNITRSCLLCNLNCGNWSSCSNGIQNRSCTHENCNATEIPITNQTCTMPMQCTDSDGNRNFTVKGTVRNIGGGNFTDYCVSTYTLNEFICNENGGEVSVQYYCFNDTKICSNGACIVETESFGLAALINQTVTGYAYLGYVRANLSEPEFTRIPYKEDVKHGILVNYNTTPTPAPDSPTIISRAHIYEFFNDTNMELFKRNLGIATERFIKIGNISIFSLNDDNLISKGYA